MKFEILRMKRLAEKILLIDVRACISTDNIDTGCDFRTYNIFTGDGNKEIGTRTRV